MKNIFNFFRTEDATFCGLVSIVGVKKSWIGQD